MEPGTFGPVNDLHQLPLDEDYSGSLQSPMLVRKQGLLPLRGGRGRR